MFQESKMNHFSFELSLIAVLPALLLCGFIFFKDRIEREPLGLLAILFGAGAISYIPSTLLESNLILCFRILQRGSNI